MKELTLSITRVAAANPAASTGAITIIIFQKAVGESAKAFSFAFRYKARNIMTVNAVPVCPLGNDCIAFFIALGSPLQMEMGAHTIFVVESAIIVLRRWSSVGISGLQSSRK